jgi:apolipoprotein N-acyltransferase
MVLITVLLFYLAFPSGGVGYLSWVALVPVIIALNRSSGRNAFMLGLLAATLGWMCSIWWAISGVSEITSTPPNLVIPIIFLLCLLSALPYAIACWLYVRLKLGHSVTGALKSAVIFTVLVNYIPHILPGNLAHALYQQPVFLQLADVGGVALVFLIVNCINFLLANAITLVKKDRLKAIACIVCATIIFFGNICYGQYRIQQPNSSQFTSSKTLNIAVIQPNIEVSNRTRDDWLKQRKKLTGIFNELEQRNEIDLVILPEIPVPISYQYYPDDKFYFDRHFSSKPLLLTTIKPVVNAVNNSNEYFNTMEFIDEGKVNQEYSKQVLLPFGEYIPFEKSMPWLRGLFPYAPNYKKGNQSVLLSLKGKTDTITAVPLICYEAVFTDIVGKGVRNGGEILINSSNDAWFNDQAGKNTHYALSVFRSIEYRKYLVRATNTGMSGIITPYGSLLDSSQIDNNTMGYAISELDIKPLESFYSNYPNLIKYLLLSFALVIMLFDRKKNVNY